MSENFFRAQIGAQVAVFQNDQLLLVQREDFEVWTLPGGYIDAGESAAQAAVREVKEETGLDVRLTHIVGMYVMPELMGTQLNDHVIVYGAEVTGGEMIAQPEEAVNIGFFARDNLPSPLLCWNERRIHDALRGARGINVRQYIDHNGLFDMSRLDLYAARDAECAALGITRVEYFLKHVSVRAEIVDFEPE